MKEKPSRRMYIIVIAALSLLALIGISSIFYSFYRANQEVMVNVAPTRNLIVASDGSTHSLDVKFSVEMPRKLSKELNTNMLQRVLTKAMENVSFDKLNEAHSVDHIKEVAKEELKKTFGEDAQIKVYVGDLAIDAPEPPTENKGSEVLKGLFKGVD